MNRILYIDDSVTNLEIFKEKFSHAFDINLSSNPTKIFNILQGSKFDAIILDIHMPILDGFEILEVLRESRFSNIPVLLYTSDELQVIRYKALASNACDIIYRTLTDKEIELRIKNKITLFKQKNKHEKHLKLNSLALNLETQVAFHNDINLNLTPIEFKILKTLIKNYPEKITRDQLVKKSWDQETVLDRTVNTHLTNLRNKLPEFEFAIESYRGTGVSIRQVSQLDTINDFQSTEPSFSEASL